MSWFGPCLAFSSATLASLPAAPYPASNSASYGYDTPREPTTPVTAPADPTPSPAPLEEFAARPVTLEARFGLGAPTGLLGLAVTYSPLPAFGFDCGAGTNTLGLQLACSVRGRLVLSSRERSFGLDWARALTLSSGFSGGRYVDSHFFEQLTAVDGPRPAELHFARAYWWNADLGAEWRDGAFVLRVFVGVALLLNPNAYAIVKREIESRVEPASTTLLYFGLGLGGAP
jgi:hypothetical protein